METIKEIKACFEQTSLKELNTVIQFYQQDERKGVRQLLEKYEKKWEAYQAEIRRTGQMWKFERENPAFSFICGIDEVGRGPLAGPVVAAAVILPKDCELLYINDSKKLSAQKREELYKEIQNVAVSVGVGVVGVEQIDKINILQATYEAMRIAISKLSVKPDLLLNDAVTIPGISVPQIPIIRGDAKSISIAAASIIAKVTRDHMMEEYDTLFPIYAFASNKGYGSTAHIQALKQYGPSPIHRKTFIKNICDV